MDPRHLIFFCTVFLIMTAATVGHFCQFQPLFYYTWPLSGRISFYIRFQLFPRYSVPFWSKTPARRSPYPDFPTLFSLVLTVNTRLLYLSTSLHCIIVVNSNMFLFHLNSILLLSSQDLYRGSINQTFGEDPET